MLEPPEWLSSPLPDDDLTTPAVEPHPRWGLTWLLLLALSAAAAATLAWLGWGR